MFLFVDHRPYSPWARAQNFTCRYHSRWRNLLMIFENLYVCRWYFGMITLPEWQLYYSYQPMKLPTPFRKLHFWRWCILLFRLMYRTFVSVSLYCLWYHFKENLWSFHSSQVVKFPDQYRGHCSSLNYKQHSFLHNFRLNDILSFSPVSSRNGRDIKYKN